MSSFFNSGLGQVIVGAVIAFGAQYFFMYYDRKKVNNKNLCLIYFDLYSIKQRVLGEFDLKKNDDYPQLNYSDFWKEALINVESLDFEEIELTYKIYELVSKYNEKFYKHDFFRMSKIFVQVREIFKSEEWC